MKRNLINDEIKVQTTEKGRGTGMTTRAILKTICVLAEKDIERVVFVSRCRGSCDHARNVMFNVYKTLGFEPKCPDAYTLCYEKKWDGVNQGFDAEIIFITAEQAERDWVKYTLGKITKAVFD